MHIAHHCPHSSRRLASQEVFGSAVQVQKKTHGSMRVVVECNGTKIVDVAQRDLFRKYRWPAKPQIVQMLEMYKEECCS